MAFLIRYLFTYQQATQKIGELSGGERSRLQLALLVLSGANFLLLDEPTNNLDIASAEVLEAALDDFVGTVLVISHDRYFLDRIVDRLLVMENGQVEAYPGGYSDYLADSLTDLPATFERIIHPAIVSSIKGSRSTGDCKYAERLSTGSKYRFQPFAAGYCYAGSHAGHHRLPGSAAGPRFAIAGRPTAPPAAPRRR